ncbi:TetR/AcrR family transcriptional regulator [Amnibacterium kyonggiense]
MGASPQLRSDARENRDRIVAAARALFRERGLAVGTSEIAHRARVGTATLHRRFPTREALIEEAFASEMRSCRRIVIEGSGERDAWRGLSATIRDLVSISTRNRRFVSAVQAAALLPPELVEHRRELLRVLDDMVRRAQIDGEVRPDLALDDIVLILRAGRGLPGAVRDRGRSAPDRYTELLLDAIRVGR